MRKTAFLLVLFFLGFIRLSALEVKGRVLSSEGKPVREAVLLHRPSGTKSLTDEKGQFVIKVPDVERVRLEVIHPDYMEEEIVLTSKNLPRMVVVTLIPYIRQREEVVVTAMRYPEPSSKVPAAASVISAETLAEKMAPNISEGLSSLPGVTNLGSGGFSIVPTIRGLARRRVLVMIDNARITGDRRTGPNASFIIPELIDRIEILRSPSSVFYGSDAIGGIVHILTRKEIPDKRFGGKVNAKYASVNREKALGLSFFGTNNKWGYFFSFQGIDADNYSSPFGEVPQSGYSQYNLFGKLSYQTGKRELEMSFLGARGVDIGKPNRDSATKPTWYPHEDQNLLQFHWLEKDVWDGGDLSLHIFVNPNFLETMTERWAATKTRESYSKTESTDYGFQLSAQKKIASHVRLNAGADYFGRSGVNSINKDITFDSQGNVTKTFEETPFTNGRRRDIGFFISCDSDGLKNLDLVGGLRWDVLDMEANPGGAEERKSDSRKALTGFLAGSLKLKENIVLFTNLSRAYRAPSLSERFYTGITGRGFIVAKADLKPEESLSLDAGVKFIGRRFFVGLYSFYYEIDNMIERYLVSNQIYTYGNIDKGEIRGVELEWECFPVPGWNIFGNLTALKGTSEKTKTPLNDIPPLRLFLGTRVWMGRFTGEVNATFQGKIKNPGPAEIAIPGAEYFNLKASYYVGSTASFYFQIANLFNRAYIARPDPESMEEPGRNFVLGITYSF